jgi:hypothetical protein
MAESGLSYDQGPPFGAPLRYFLVAPLFILLAAGLGIFLPDWLTTRWSPISLALTHLVTLGYLAMVMLGSLLQMLPVVLGTPVPAVRLVGWLGLLGLSIGTPCLALGFLLGEPLWLYAGMWILAAGLIPFSFAISFSLIKTAAPLVASPIRQAALALVITLLLGILLAGAFSSLWPVSAIAELTALHAAWGLIGWVLILIIGVSYQVVPMLQITQPYPRWLTRGLTWILFLGLLLISVAAQIESMASVGLLGTLLLCVGSIVFAGVTLRLQAGRRRKVPDITLNFWRFGMASLIVSGLIFPVLHWLPEDWTDAAEISLGITFLLGFVASVVGGMLYKIVPFLAWFHLKTQTHAKIGSIPNMKQMIPDNLARIHFRLHLASLALLLPAPFLPAPINRYTSIAGLLLLAASALRQSLNLQQAKRLFLKHGGYLD